ncbi:MAG: MBL fold metallo-hydrolase [Chloroflexota bacterium]
MEKVFTGKTTDSIQAIYKLGNKVVNWYLIESVSEIYIIDTGFAGFWKQFVDAMQKIKRSFNEVSAVLLTHAHLDHTGFAERARQRTTAEVYIHESGAGTVTFEHFDIPAELSSNLWRPKTFTSFLTQAIKNDAFKVKPVGLVKPFKDNEKLNFPGNPKAIYTPGHSIDHSAFYLEDLGILFSGDALCTSSPITLRKYPPHVMKAGDDTVLATKSLKAFAEIEDVLMLPGHGEPWVGNLNKETEKIVGRGVLL